MDAYLMGSYAWQREREIAAAVGRRPACPRALHRLGGLLIAAGLRLQRWSAGARPRQALL